MGGEARRGAFWLKRSLARQLKRAAWARRDSAQTAPHDLFKTPLLLGLSSPPLGAGSCYSFAPNSICLRARRPPIRGAGRARRSQTGRLRSLPLPAHPGTPARATAAGSRRSEPKGGIEPFDRLVWQVMTKERYASAGGCSGSSTTAPITAEGLVDRLQGRLILVHLPLHASWLNQVEIYHSIIQRKVLDPNDFENSAQLARAPQRLRTPLQRDRPAV